MAEEKPHKKIKERKKIKKEAVVFSLMGVFIFLIFFAGVFFIRRFHWDFKQKIEKIRQEQNIVSGKGIKQEDLGRVEEFFRERENKYNESGEINVKEAF